MQLDGVQIGVGDLDGAADGYRRLLGLPPVTLPGGVRRFQLEFGAVELEAGSPGVHSMRFTFDGEQPADWPESPADFHGLDVRLEPLRRSSVRASRGPDRPHAVDHLVIHSGDLDRAVALWRDRLGLRLALDRTFPQRGLRMLFFRSGGMTLEFVSAIERSSEPAGPDRFYGLAYRVADLAACRDRLLTEALDVSDMRAGHKLGTFVVTVHSGTAGVPTLLIEDPSRTGKSGPVAADPGSTDPSRGEGR